MVLVGRVLMALLEEQEAIQHLAHSLQRMAVEVAVQAPVPHLAVAVAAEVTLLLVGVLQVLREVQVVGQAEAQQV